MRVIVRWIRLFTSYCLFALFFFAAIHYETTVYLIFQGKGQMHVLFNRIELAEYAKREDLSAEEKRNIELVAEIKKFSVDTLGYLPTKNFTQVFDQKNSPALWVISACEPYELKAYYWRFPIVGRVSYKGFFKKEKAVTEFNHLRAMNMDMDLRTVTAWSTLGWFKDPLMSGMLKRKKGALCNLLFHELFHATYYAANNINFNENIACFIADKATQLFLAKDTAGLNEYVRSEAEHKIVHRFMLRKSASLRNFYSEKALEPKLPLLKIKFLLQIADSVRKLPVREYLQNYHYKSVLEQKNAYFVDFDQYDSMQDSLESIFNKIYKGDLKKLVRDLKQKQTIITFDH
jgi:predicted aminopeptidase